MVTRIGPKTPVKHFLREWRETLGLTQQQLADRLPLGDDGKPTGKDQISRWERSKRGMTMDVQAALAIIYREVERAMTLRVIKSSKVNSRALPRPRAAEPDGSIKPSRQR